MSDTGTIFTINIDGEVTEKQVITLANVISYEDLRQENERLKKQNAKYREALEFYGNRENWNDVLVDWGYHTIIDDDYKFESLEYSGRRAREALKDGGE